MKSFTLRKPLLAIVAIAAATLSGPHDAHAFCGFYVGKADATLTNHASQVAMVHHDDKTVISLMNDYEGEPSQFALVVPVPVVLKKEQVHVGDRALFDRLNDYSSPRLVEYQDPDPCNMPAPMAMGMSMSRNSAALERDELKEKAHGVTVEAEYTVGEYDIVMLSAKQSSGLETWLIENGYHIPQGASRALAPYIKLDMKFFVAKVNLEEHRRTGLTYLRPLQFAFDSPKFMLPIRLGMINANGSQDLVIYMLTENGRVETTNYRTVKLPTGMDIPEYVRNDFGGFYKAMFNEQVKRNDMHAVFTEYVWSMGWCDPCAGQPLTREELRSLGVFWLDDGQNGGIQRQLSPYRVFGGGSLPVMLTRLHVRYSADTFPEDLSFQETSDTENWQARYVLRHAWTGSRDACTMARSYFRGVDQRHREEARTLADLTGWPLDDVFKKAGLSSDGSPEPWWKGLWD